MQDVVDVYEILLKDREQLRECLKPYLKLLIEKEIFFKIPIFKLKFKDKFKDEVKRLLCLELIYMLHIHYDDLRSILEEKVIRDLLEEHFYNLDYYK